MASSGKINIEEQRAITLGWTRSEDGRWWQSDGWPCMEFTFDRDSPDPNWKVKGLNQRLLLRLEIVLLHSTGLKFDFKVFNKLTVRFRVLKTFPNDTVRSLYEAFTRCNNPTPVLRNVEFSGQPQSSGEITLQAWFLRQACSGKFRDLESLKIEGLTVLGTEFLTTAIETRNLQSLAYLDISGSTEHQTIHSDCIVSLAASLGRNGCSLQSLNFDMIMEARAHLALAQLLQSGSLRALEKFQIYGTVDWGTCAEAYGSALSSGRLTSLKSLVLQATNLADEGGQEIARGLRAGNMTALENLDLSKNSMKDSTLESLASCWEAGACPSLRFLNISGNYWWSESSFGAFARALSSGHLNKLEQISLDIPREEFRRLLVAAFAENSFLTADVVDTNYKGVYLEEQMRRQLKMFREKNLRHVSIHSEWDPASVKAVKAMSAKVYLCGSPNMGKTTLRKSMQRGFWEAKFMSESRLHGDERTRGINVVNVGDKGEDAISLTIWDMAGQEEFHLLHYAFFKDLASRDGKETSFVVVFNTDQSLEDMRTALDYWMRFVASTCIKGIHHPRNVFAVLNLSNGNPNGKVELWRTCVEEARKTFDGYLAIYPKHFVADLRRRNQVANLKRCLLEHSTRMLENKVIPNICHQIHRHLKLWVTQNQSFPIFTMNEFEEKARLLDGSWTKSMLQTALKYMNENGSIIYLYGVDIVVLDPNWICSTIVGNMFVSNDEEFFRALKLERLFRTNVNPSNGSIHVLTLKKFFKAKQPLREWLDPQLDNLVTILLWLGLCYKGEEGMLFIPSLIQDIETEGDYWESKLGEHHEKHQWVMGYSVQQRTQEIGFAPIRTLWHRLQIDLGQAYGKRNSMLTLDHDFSLGKSYVVFKEQGMLVRIEVEEGERNITFERINFYVKPLNELVKKTRADQLDLARHLVEMLLDSWIHICPGVGYIQYVIWPWLACKSLKDEEVQFQLEEWKTDVNEVMEKVLKHGMGIQYPDRKVGVSETITYDDLLSTKELENVMNILNDVE